MLCRFPSTLVEHSSKTPLRHFVYSSTPVRTRIVLKPIRRRPSIFRVPTQQKPYVITNKGFKYTATCRPLAPPRYVLYPPRPPSSGRPSWSSSPARPSFAPSPPLVWLSPSFQSSRHDKLSKHEIVNQIFVGIQRNRNTHNIVRSFDPTESIRNCSSASTRFSK